MTDTLLDLLYEEKFDARETLQELKEVKDFAGCVHCGQSGSDEHDTEVKAAEDRLILVDKLIQKHLSENFGVKS